MSRKLPHLLATRRSKTIIATILLFYTLLSFHSSNKRLFSQFYPNKNDYTILPTTSHSQDLNLKADVSFNKKSNELHNLRDQLSFAFPYDPQAPIPQRVWQTWKVGTGSKDFPSTFKTYQKTWAASSSSSEHSQYSLIPDDSIIPLLENLYGTVPLVVRAFKLMPINILKADFLRYLLLFARGGVYSDMDTTLLKPIESWPSQNKSWMNNIINVNTPIPYKNLKVSPVMDGKIQQQPGLVIGIEADPDREDWSTWYARRIQFCQWTIQAKPGHPILRELILNITATTLMSVEDPDLPIKVVLDPTNNEDYNVNYRYLRRNNETYPHSESKNNKNVDGTDIMNWTGPGIFSDIIFEYMNNALQHNNDILLINPNLNKNEGEDGATASTSEADGSALSKSTRRFYKKISESLQSSNVMPWEFFSFLKDPVIVDDVMVLPITSFSPDVNQMGAQSSDDKMAFVKHMFGGTWKDDADRNAGHT
ncbi:hypothetical protein N7582_002133 [Saccharomyces uvarum]|uniref:Initiation-specific alpha-1,6-mannosyltransferase n=1 Tax=Saccharomyces uvarum TaxID=230603 RepID=A0AA35JHM3_SACUV|nr:hypothetical protein N7582_002133 [Saccharomyces uvarum]CAI4062434.1 hypothetical protein SUVC_07G2040 [Saccharomyces uvarum]